MVTANLLTGGIDERFVRTTATETDNYLTDALSSTVVVTGSTGSSQVEYSYEPFGSISITGTTTNSYTFTGREIDGLGINYYRARYYNPQTGRFISEDPIGFRGGINKYAYVGNDPIDFNDPFGMDKKGPPICGGTFGFTGMELDLAEGGAFTGAIVENDSVDGWSAGTLNELWLGGEGPVAGVGKITSPQSPGIMQGWLGFVGGGINVGPLAGAQAGYAAGSGWGGLYVEGHLGPWALGTGGYLRTSCAAGN